MNNAMSLSHSETTIFVPRHNFGKPTILIVEDHDDTRELLRTLYEMWGCRVVEACNGLEAVDAASRERPALILIDGNLPLLDGLGATRRIRENRLLNDVRIVALTGSSSASYAAAALDAGCNDCLVKPFDLQRLKDYLVPFRWSRNPTKKTQHNQMKAAKFHNAGADSLST